MVREQRPFGAEPGSGSQTGGWLVSGLGVSGGGARERPGRARLLLAGMQVCNLTSQGTWSRPRTRHRLKTNKALKILIIIIMVMTMTIANIYFGAPLCQAVGSTVCFNELHEFSGQTYQVDTIFIPALQTGEPSPRRLVKVLKLHSW